MDPAFVWQNPSPPPPPRGWIRVEQASAVTGVPVTTIRNWARKQKIASKLEEGERVVLRGEVMARARHLGRLRPESHADPGEQQTEAPPASRPPEPPLPEGSMLVPIDEWRRILGQLGNLHAAGQQLAEARERAAKAETEAQFLKERVRELRGRLEAQPEAVPETADETADAPLWLYLLRRWGPRGR